MWVDRQGYSYQTFLRRPYSGWCPVLRIAGSVIVGVMGPSFCPEASGLP